MSWPTDGSEIEHDIVLGPVPPGNVRHMVAISRDRLVELEAAERQRDKATAALAIVEFGNQILPPAIRAQDRCVRCDAMRYEGHAKDCRLAAALTARPAMEDE